MPSWLEQKTSAGQTPFWVACREGHLPVCMLLKERFNCNVNARTLDDRPPVWIAAYMGHLEILK